MKINVNPKFALFAFFLILIFSCKDQNEINPVFINENYEVSYEAGSRTIEIKTKDEVSASMPDSIKWISYTLENKKLIITYTENEEAENRKATISFYADNIAGDITIIQGATQAPRPILSSFTIKASENNDVLTEDLNAEVSENIITLPFNYTPKSLRLLPSIESSADEVLFCINNETISDLTQAIDFSKNVECLLRNKTGKFNKYTIKTKSDNGIPVMYIHTKGSVPIDSKDIYVDGNIRFDGIGAVPSLEASTKIKGRGNSTWGFPKKPYRIKFDDKQELAGFPAHKDWVLLANYIDPSLIKNSVAFKISSLLEMEWSNRNISVDLYLNGEYYGNYLLCEQIKIGKNRINIAELKDNDIDGENITGGYLLELDTYFDEEQKFRSEVRNLPVMIKDPELNDAQFSWIKNHFNNVEKVLYSYDFLDPENGYKKYIDNESFIKWWLVYELMGNSEPTSPKSSYMLKERNGKFKMCSVWDFDWYSVCVNPERLDNIYAIWYNRLFMDPDFVSHTKEIWNKNKDMLNKEIIEFIKQKEKSLILSAEKNRELWPNEIDNPDRFDIATGKMKLYFEKRIKWMDNAINNL